MKCLKCGNEMLEGAVVAGPEEILWIPKGYPLPNLVRKRVYKKTKVPKEIVVLRTMSLTKMDHRMKCWRCPECKTIIIMEEDNKYEDSNIYL